MKIRNMNIGARLYLGFSIIILFIVMLGFFAYNQSGRLWKITDDLYNHPYAVSKATRDVKIDIDAMHNCLKSIAMDPNLGSQELEQNIIMITNLEAAVYGSFNVIYDRYLGPKEDVDRAYHAFRDWKHLRDKVIQLRLQGNIAAAYTAYKKDNVQYREKVFSQVQVMIDYATNKAIVFYQTAEKEKEKLLSSLKIAVLGIFLFSMLIVYILFRGIRTPLRVLTKVADRYRHGNYDIRSKYDSTNEIGRLASAFNNMAASVQQEISVKENIAALSQLLIKENELRPFCKELLNSLRSKTNSQIASIYFLNERKAEFEHFESIGLNAKNCKPYSVTDLEGEFGAVLTQKKIVRIEQIPDDTIFSFPTVIGKFKPRDIITIPVLNENVIVAIISLASLHNFSSAKIQFLNDIQFMLTARLNGVIAFQEITDISRKLDQQNHDLEEKSKELALQADELKEYNIALKMQKKQVDEANQFKSAFLSNMSHELRTPLNSVIALSGVLTRKLKDLIPRDEYNYVEIIEKNGKQLLLLINDILDLSRIESGKEEISISKVNIYNLVQSIVESLEPLSSEKGIRISNTIERNMREITSDNAKCHHILQNIISNAVKFTDEGSVEISATQETNDILIHVKDTGIGILQENIPLIFDEFRQADEKTSRRFGGTGLGLAIAKKYIIMLNGSIDVKSEPGSGSTFTITLPMTKTVMKEPDNEPGPASSPTLVPVSYAIDNSSGKGKSILLVEDSEAQILQMSYILSKNGYSLTIARNGKEALEAISISIPDAMILDLMMPEVDGFEVLAAIRNHKDTSQIPVLILSAKHITKQELTFLKGNHIHQIILKGVVNRSELLAHIHTMVNPPARKTATHLSPGKSHPGKAVILVVEDNPDNLETVKALLSGKHEIYGAADSTEGLIKARALNPDLILLDISLPGMDGFATFDELRKDENLRHIPVVALTARAMKGDREELLAYGFDGYVSKPIDSELMDHTINMLLNG